MAGIARYLSKLGVCSRSQAAQWVQSGRVRINGRLPRSGDEPVPPAARVELDGKGIGAPRRCYLMLNKPRGLLTTTQDEQARDTIYSCLEGLSLPWLAPVGRLDKASEGLLLLSNDPQWAANLTEPANAIIKRYHVQIDCIPDTELLDVLRKGIVDRGEKLGTVSIDLLRTGGRHAWLDIALDEGRNRQIRRLLEAQQIRTLRLIRIAIGALQLGDLAKGQVRALSATELAELSPKPPAHTP